MTRAFALHSVVLACLVSCSSPAPPPRPTTAREIASGRTTAAAVGSGSPAAPNQGRHTTIQGTPVALLPWTEARCLDLAWSPDSKNVAALGARAYILDGDTLRKRSAFGYSGMSDGTIRWSPDGNVVATASYRVSLWDARTGAHLRDLEQSYGAQHIDWRGRAIASVVGDALSAWDAESGKQLWTRPLPDAGIVRAVTISPDGQRVAVGFSFNQLGVWRMADGSPIWSRSAGARGMLASVAFSPDGALLGTADGLAGTITLWDATRAAEPLRVINRSCYGGRAALGFHPDGKRLGTWCGSKLELWSLTTGELEAEVPVGAHGIGNFGSRLAWSPDGRRLAVGGEGGVRVLTPETASVVEARAGSLTKVAWQGTAAWGPDGRRLYDPRTAALWQASTGRAHRYAPPGAQVRRVAVHPREPLLALFGSDSDASRGIQTTREWLVLWDIGQGKARAELRLPPYHFATSLAFDPTGQTLVAQTASEDGGQLLLWDALTGEARRQDPAGGRIPGGVVQRRWSPARPARVVAEGRLAQGRGSAAPTRPAQPQARAWRQGHEPGRSGHRARAADRRAAARCRERPHARRARLACGRATHGPAPRALRSRLERRWEQGGCETRGRDRGLGRRRQDGATALRPADGMPDRADGDAALSADFGFVAIPAVDGTRILRLADGASVLLVAFEQGAELLDLVVSDGGLVDGDDRALATLVFRVGDDSRSAALVSLRDVTAAVRRPGLLGELLRASPCPTARSPCRLAVDPLPAGRGSPRARGDARCRDRGTMGAVDDRVAIATLEGHAPQAARAPMLLGVTALLAAAVGACGGDADETTSATSSGGGTGGADGGSSPTGGAGGEAPAVAFLGFEGDYGDVGIRFALTPADGQPRSVSLDYRGCSVTEWTPTVLLDATLAADLDPGEHTLTWASWEQEAGCGAEVIFQLTTSEDERAESWPLDLANVGAHSGFASLPQGAQGIGPSEIGIYGEALQALLGASALDFVATRIGTSYEVRAARGSVIFRRSNTNHGYRYDVLEVAGQNPIAIQDPSLFPTLAEELARGSNPNDVSYPSLGYDTGDPRLSFIEPEDDSYPYGYERIAAYFDHPDAADLDAQLP